MDKEKHYTEMMRFLKDEYNYSPDEWIEKVTLHPWKGYMALLQCAGLLLDDGHTESVSSVLRVLMKEFSLDIKLCQTQ